MDPTFWFRELRHRKVFRVAAGYAIVGWILIQVADTVMPRLNLPGWAVTATILLVLMGLPVALVLAWALEITPDGIRRAPAATPSRQAEGAPRRRWRQLLLAGIAALLGLGAFSFLRDEGEGARSEQSRRILSIAVLPFADMSASGDQRYFGHGLSEELLNLLAQVEGLRVAARTSSFRYDGISSDIRAIGSELGVEAVLEGSVRKAGERIRITAQLVDAATGYHLWSETYDRELTDVFAVQDEISRAIVVELGFTNAEEAARKRHTESVAAYEAFLQGQYERSLIVGSDYAAGEAHALQAIDFFRRALALDSTYALAWTEIAVVYAQTLADNFWPPSRAYPLARDAALRAIAVDPDLAEAHLSLALIKWWSNWDHAGAEQSMLRALELDPDNAVVHSYRSRMLMATGGSPQLALRELERAAELDSARFAEWARWDVIRVRIRMGEADALIDSLNAVIAQDSSKHWMLAHAHWWARRTPIGDSPWPITPATDPLTVSRAGGWMGIAGDRDGAEAALHRLRELADERYVAPDLMAAVHASLGRADSAFVWLERAVDVRSAYLVDGALDEPYFDPIRSDRRFVALRRRLNLTPG